MFRVSGAEGGKGQIRIREKTWKFDVLSSAPLSLSPIDSIDNPVTNLKYSELNRAF